MATTKVRGEVVDFNPGNPDYILDSTNAVTVINSGGNQYNFNGVYGKFGAKIGTITLTGVPAGHPIAFINNGKTSQISYTGTVDEGTATGPDGNTYTFYSGTVTLTVSADFGTISYYCKIHGYMGGQDNLVYTYSESGLKIPTGTNANRPATDVAGMVRNNTNESSDSSASCEEYYNGTAWQKINNVAIPVYYRAVLYTGTGSAQSITGVGFKPDFVWLKVRSASDNHTVFDTTRGVQEQLYPNLTNSQSNSAASLTSFDSDGFTIGNSTALNDSGKLYVAYCWQANGGTTSSNTDGSITSTVQAIDAAGFSIVQYNGNGSGGATIGHGLSSAPELTIIKKSSSTEDWYYQSEVQLGAWDKNLRLNTTGGLATGSTFVTGVSSSVTTLGTSTAVNGNGVTYINYNFYSVAGYSKFGNYTGDGQVGQSITTGFEPTWVLLKSTVGTDNWRLYDSTRGFSAGYLEPNTSDSENTTHAPCIAVSSTGFSITSGGVNAGNNANGNLYIYLAFK